MKKERKSLFILLKYIFSETFCSSAFTFLPSFFHPHETQLKPSFITNTLKEPRNFKFTDIEYIFGETHTNKWKFLRLQTYMKMEKNWEEKSRQWKKPENFSRHFSFHDIDWGKKRERKKVLSMSGRVLSEQKHADRQKLFCW